MRWLLSTTVVAAGVALAAGSAQAVDLTIVSWGGAYTASQQGCRSGMAIVSH